MSTRTALPGPRRGPARRARREDLYAIPGGAEPAPRLRPWMVFTVVVIIAFFGLIYSRISLDHSAFILDELNAEIAEQESLHWDLRLEAARLQTPQRIAEGAAELGLVYPQERSLLPVLGARAEGPLTEDLWSELRALLSAAP